MNVNEAIQHFEGDGHVVSIGRVLQSTSTVTRRTQLAQLEKWLQLENEIRASLFFFFDIFSKKKNVRG
jgi:hypothetical protein